MPGRADSTSTSLQSDLSYRHARLVREQRAAIIAIAPDLHRHAPQRLEAALEGLRDRYLDVLEAAGLTATDLDRCWQAYEADRRLAFLYDLPTSAVFGVELGCAFETALYGDTTDRGSVLVGMINLYTKVADGLLDETPELFGPEQSRMLRLVRGETHGVDGLDEKPPVIRLAYYLLLTFLDQAGRPGAHALAKAFQHSCIDALVAEFASVKQDFTRRARDVDAQALVGKGIWPMWSLALAPACVRGWPRHLDLEDYRALALALGAYFAWLDDTTDLLVDYNAGIWNLVMLDIANDAGATLAGLAPGELARALDDASRRQALVRTGRQHYLDLLQCAAKLPGNTDRLLALVADLTFSWLPSD